MSQALWTDPVATSLSTLWQELLSHAFVLFAQAASSWIRSGCARTSVDGCKRRLVEQNLAERVAVRTDYPILFMCLRNMRLILYLDLLSMTLQWRLARCRDFFESNLTPYFETGVDTVEDAALRITQAAIAMARSIPLGAQAHVAVEMVEVLRKHGLKGIYGLILRKEFLAAADLLCRVLGINKTAWPLSVHELSAAIFYALAQHRAMRGINPEREHLIHTFRSEEQGQ